MQADKEECTTTPSNLAAAAAGKYRSLDWTHFWALRIQVREGETTALFYFSLSC